MASLLLVMTAAAGIAHGEATATAGYAVEDWVTGFPVNADRVGPVGVAVRGDRIFVSAFPSGRIYVFDQDVGGVAGPATELTSTPIAGLLTGLAFDGAGRLYGALKGYGAIVELSVVDGRVLRTVASEIPCALGLATDPLSGDLFVSQPCGVAGIKRIHGGSSGPAAVSQYTLTAGAPIDGIEFGADGTLYGASETAIHRVSGTDQPDAGAASILAAVAGGDGLAVAAGPQPDKPPYLLAITTNGTIEKIDLTAARATVTRIVSGGSRGDLGAVGSNGCLYATQSDRVIKVTQSDGTCQLKPSLATSPPFTPVADTPAESAARAATAKRALSILSLARSARTLTRARRVRLRVRLVGPALYAVRFTIVDLRGRTLARGSTRRLAGKRVLSLTRTGLRFRPGIVRLRAGGRAGGTTRVTLTASRRLTR